MGFRRSARRNGAKRTRRKWRQQKLSVGTVAKIAKKVAGALDRKHMKQFRFSKPYTADGFVWSSNLQLPPQNRWRPVTSGALEAKVISDLGGYVTDASADNLSIAKQESLEINVKGVQCRFAVQNRNTISMRVKAMLVFIPNLNNQTDDAVDFLRPDVFMLYKQGTGNILYDGFDKEELKTLSTGASSVRRYSILAQKTIVCHPTYNSGFPTDDGAIITPPGYTEQAIKTHKFSLTHYFKGNGKKSYIKSTAVNGTMLADGNYYFLLWSDLPTAETFHYVACSSIKFYIKESSAAVNT